MKLTLVALGATLVLAACSSPPQKTTTVATPVFRTIHTLQNERNTQGLLPYLVNEHAQTRLLAALAFASVQDTTANPQLHRLLSDLDVQVRAAAAFAVGQTGGRSAAAALASAAEQETNPAALATMLEALGKTGNKSELDLLLTHDTDTAILNGRSWGLYRAALRGVTPANTAETAVSRLRPTVAYHTRLASAHTLARLPKTDLSPWERDLATVLQTEKAPEIRAALATALAGLKTERQPTLLSNLAAKDPDYRVRLSALRSLSKNLGTIAETTALAALADAHPHVAQTAAQYFVAHAKPAQASLLLEKARKTADWHTRALLLQAALKTAPQQERQPIREFLEKLEIESKNEYEKAQLIKAAAEDLEHFPHISQIALEATSPVLSTAATEALIEQRKNPKLPEGLKPLFAEIFQRMAATADVAKLGLVAAALREPGLNLAANFTDLSFLKTAQSKLQLPRDIEAYLEVQKTLAFLAGQSEPAPTKTTATHPINWQVLQQIAPEQKAVVTTSKGTFVLQLLAAEAPASVANFVALVNQGFYNGKAFHRVVPNFVAQGGCPRGDGWGSTDYTIRSEFAPVRYQTGGVGLASAGKDTESCQWFITHSPTPHLDGRYTLFAQVVKGMEVVHQLQVGDIIQHIKLQ